ncbi:MAG: replication-relaxation family protein [Clostridium sp.]|nr:replication-relaxation family protein [Clostridium sp.]
MTERDLKIIELLKCCKVLTREQIQKVLFKDVHMNICLRRLKVLTENKDIKRAYFQLERHKNVYVYYLDKKPSKRNIIHNLSISEFLTDVMLIADIKHIETNYKIGNIIADAYIRYQSINGIDKRLFLEVQRSNKVEDCVQKYRNIKDIILEEKPRWNTMPRLIVLTDLEHNNEQLKSMKVYYDNLKAKNTRALIF